MCVRSSFQILGHTLSVLYVQLYTLTCIVHSYSPYRTVQKTWYFMILRWLLNSVLGICSSNISELYLAIIENVVQSIVSCYKVRSVLVSDLINTFALSNQHSTSSKRPVTITPNAAYRQIRNHKFCKLQTNLLVFNILSWLFPYPSAFFSFSFCSK